MSFLLLLNIILYILYDDVHVIYIKIVIQQNQTTNQQKQHSKI